VIYVAVDSRYPTGGGYAVPVGIYYKLQSSEHDGVFNTNLTQLRTDISCVRTPIINYNGICFLAVHANRRTSERFGAHDPRRRPKYE